ncbi:hypothetical protein D7X94_00045 [Acutalibacter sp. 1XD8-33]|uniref:hypothetical protein n=1 Tax=Acutalibacter sp. 1XD8-33 TaxID=2320081 RepID=UPI000EA1DFDC|nr:hypothetical protein [Acutalibacter sp. 1XD8-33]RKJ41916.1 hypothetical protein D7X94_00045 [Acutalibacter sp. 1XD8-33]
MNEFLTTLLQAVLVAAVPVCAAFIGKGLKALAGYLGQKSENETAKKYLAAAADAVATAVTYTSQVYVDKLKETGQFTKENQREALGIAVAQAKNLLTAEAAAFLENAYGDLNEYLKSRIEAEVRNQKMGVGTLTFSA